MLGQHGRKVTKALCEAPAKALARVGVTANMVTVSGTVLTIACSAGFLGTGRFALGAVVLGLVLLADSLDGVLARVTGTSSRFGAFLDSTLDRIGDGAVFASLVAGLIWWYPEDVWRTIGIVSGLIAMVGAATVPYARARGESIGVTPSVGIAERTDRLLVALVAAFGTGVWGATWILALGLLWVAFASIVTVWQRISYVRRHLESGR